MNLQNFLGKKIKKKKSVEQLFLDKVNGAQIRIKLDNELNASSSVNYEASSHNNRITYKTKVR